MIRAEWVNLIEFNANVLEQANEAIDHCVEFDVPFASHVGPHLRHVIEHYEALIAGVGRVTIEYDQRHRNRTLEKDPLAARARIESMAVEIRSMTDLSPDHSVGVAFDGGLQGEFNFSASSTLSRELLFLPHHAIHHFALVKSFLTDQGISLKPEFGLAPATIKHVNRVAS